MDPTNSTTPTPSPAPTGVPVPEPSAPVAGVNAGADAGLASSPMSSGVVGAPTPVNPIINPTGGGVGQNLASDVTTGGVAGQTMTPGIVIQDSAPAPVEPVATNPTPANPVFQPSQDDSLKMAATDPIMMPEKAPEPDPVEEELKAPMKAAGPVPGSIGSAVSMPADGAVTEQPAPANGNPFDNNPQPATPSVAFNDPAKQAENPMAGNTVNSGGKKMDKKTLIILAAVASVVILVLVIVLIMSLMGGN